MSSIDSFSSNSINPQRFCILFFKSSSNFSNSSINNFSNISNSSNKILNMYKVIALAITLATIANAACVDNQTSCINSSSFRQCSNNVFYTHPCPTGTVCVNRDGKANCVTDQSFCTNGNQRCTGTNSANWEECSNNVWVKHTCSAGTTCKPSSGNRVICSSSAPPSTCTDGASKCINSSTWALCSNNVFYNQPCAPGTVCKTVNGAAKCV